MAQVQRMSRLMVKTLRDDPADAETLNHKLLVRAGYVRRTAAGIWSWLPLGKKVLENVARVVREEMDAIGGQEVLLPALLPKEPYEATGRWEEYGPELFRLKDRKGARVPPRPDPRGDLHAAGQGPVLVLQGPARDPLPDPGEVPRRGPPARRHPARPRVPDEGLVLLRHHRRGPGRVVRPAPRGVPARSSSASAWTTASSPPSPARWAARRPRSSSPRPPAGEDTFVDCPACDYAANTEAVTFALTPVDAPSTRPSRSSTPPTPRPSRPSPRTSASRPPPP